MAFQSAVGRVSRGRGGESLCQMVGNKGELLGAAVAELDECVYCVVFGSVGGSCGVVVGVFLDQA